MLIPIELGKGVLMMSIKYLCILSLVSIFAIACGSGGTAGMGSGEGDGETVACSSADDCPEGYICVNGKCVSSEEGNFGPEDEILCTIDEHCPTGMICGPDGKCHPKEGFDCVNGKCPIGFDCIDGKCRQVGKTYPCDSNDQCPPGSICRDGYCWNVGGQEDGDLDAPPATDGDMEDFYGPQIGVPDNLDFGAAILNSPVVRSLQIVSVGTDTLDIYSVILDADDDYSILDAPTKTVKLPVGDALSVTISLMPTEPGKRIGKVVITSNDHERNTIEVSLSSQYKGKANIVVEPETLEFGKAEVEGAPVKKSIMISNIPPDETSNRVLEIEAPGNIRLETPANPNFDIHLGDLEFPLYIGPGKSNAVEFEVEYHPATVERHSEVLIIENSDNHPEEDARKTIVLAGEGVIPQLEISPAGDIHFGLVTVDETEQRSIRLTNIGKRVEMATEIAVSTVTWQKAKTTPG